MMSEPNEARIRGFGREQASEEPGVEGHAFKIRSAVESRKDPASATEEPEVEGRAKIGRATENEDDGSQESIRGNV